ncbi:MAG TPA: hypothetical protein VMH78_01170 [Thermoplasmata archaeon]|nr:hypothetical protein [Thermoplasmata archaeon]
MGDGRPTSLRLEQACGRCHHSLESHERIDPADPDRRRCRVARPLPEGGEELCRCVVNAHGRPV